MSRMDQTGEREMGKLEKTKVEICKIKKGFLKKGTAGECENTPTST